MKMVLPSIRDTLDPTAPLEEITLTYIDNLKKELIEYLNFIKPVVQLSTPVNIKEIEFIEDSFRSVSSVYEALVRAINWLRVAHKALATIEENRRASKSFNVNLQNDYFQCLLYCGEALTTAIQNI